MFFRNKFPSSSHHFLRFLFHFSTSTIKTPTPQNPFIINYLTNSCGLSSTQAIKASKYLTHINSPLRPNSVLNFFNRIGFDDTQISNLIIKYPPLLCADVGKTLNPRFAILQETGFSHPEIIDLIGKNPLLLRTGDLRRRVEFWRNFLGNHENLLKGMRNGFLVSCNIDKIVVPNISYLRECGMRDDMIVKIVLRSPRTINRKLDEIKDFVKRVEELGLARGSGMFVYAYCSISTTSRAAFDAKINLLKSLGWSNEDVLVTISKYPLVLKHSNKCIRTKIDFLGKEAKCEHLHIVNNPVILSYSLNKRLAPRCHVLGILKAEGFIKSDYSLMPIMALTEKVFLRRYVIPYEKRFPKLLEAYVASCRTRTPTEENGDILLVRADVTRASTTSAPGDVWVEESYQEPQLFEDQVAKQFSDQKDQSNEELQFTNEIVLV